MKKYQYSVGQIISELRLEVVMRHQVYGRKVRQQKMSESQMLRKIGLIEEAIARLEETPEAQEAQAVLAAQTELF